METLSTLMIGSIVHPSLNVQHKAILRFSFLSQPRHHGQHGADTADKEHIPVQRDAPHHCAAEARDIPVHGVQLDDLLHIEAADRKGHSNDCIEC